MMRVFTLLCRRDLAMAHVCLSRLEAAWGRPVRLEILDDGTLDAEDWDGLRAAFPSAVFRPRREIREQVESQLARRPACLDYYRFHALANKLLAVPLIAAGAFRYVDCDVLFRRPCPGFWPEEGAALCLDEPGVYLANSLRQWIARLRSPLAMRLNSGLLAVPEGLFDLDRTEWFLARASPCRRLDLVEQTAWAFLYATRPHLRIGAPTVLSDARPLPGDSTAAALHFLGRNKARFHRFATVPFTPEAGAAAVHLDGRAGGLGYVLDRELLQTGHGIDRVWKNSAAFRMTRATYRAVAPSAAPR